MRIRAPMLFAIWALLGGLLSMLVLLAWANPEAVQSRIQSWQEAYGSGPHPAWYQRADTHIHITTSCLLCIWFGIGCRLFLPQLLPWAPMALTFVIAMVDELSQIGSATRSFEWSDQAGDVIGILIAIPLLVLFKRLRVERGPRHTRPSSDGQRPW